MSDWKTEALPVLEAAHNTSQANPYVSVEAVNAALGRDVGDPRTWNTIGELIGSGWLDVMGNTAYVYNRPNWPVLMVLSGKSRQLLDSWPADGGDALYDRFMDALAEAAAAATTPEERTGIERIREAVGSIGRGVAVSILSHVGHIHGVPV